MYGNDEGPGAKHAARAHRTGERLSCEPVGARSDARTRERALRIHSMGDASVCMRLHDKSLERVATTQMSQAVKARADVMGRLSEGRATAPCDEARAAWRRLAAAAARCGSRRERSELRSAGVADCKAVLGRVPLSTGGRKDVAAEEGSGAWLARMTLHGKEALQPAFRMRGGGKRWREQVFSGAGLYSCKQCGDGMLNENGSRRCQPRRAGPR